MVFPRRKRRPVSPFGISTPDNGTWANLNRRVIENVWCLPENAPFAIDARLEIVGTEGAIYIDNSGSQYTLLTQDGLQYPQSLYWPTVHGMRRGFLKDELDYFLKCVVQGEKPSVITPEESRDVVLAIKKAELSARENRVVEF